MEIKEYTKFRTNEILPLYTQVGWTAYTEDMAALEHGFQNSLLILAAYEKDALLGLIRVVGDGATVIGDICAGYSGVSRKTAAGHRHGAAQSGTRQIRPRPANPAVNG